MLIALVLRHDGGVQIYEMKCLFVAVGLNALFIVLPHWATHYPDTRMTNIYVLCPYFMLQ